MAQFILKVNGAKADLSAEEEIQKKLEWIQQSVLDVSGNLNFKVASTAGIKKNLTTLASRVEWHKNGMSSMRNALGSAISLYEKTEKDVCGYATGKAVSVSGISDDSKVGAAISQGKGWEVGIRVGRTSFKVGSSDIKSLLWSAVGKAGAVGKTVSAIGKAITTEDRGKMKPLGDLIKDGGEALKKIHGIDADWAKSLLGLDVKKIPEGLKEGFKAGIAEEASKITGSTILLSLVGNALGNYDEYKSGEISAGRAIQETLVETAVDVGKGVLVQGIVTAGFAAMGVAAPVGIAVAATGVVVSWAADMICKKLTGGKKVTEAVSDLIINGGNALRDAKKAVEKKVGNAVKTAKKKIGAIWNSLKPPLLFG